MGYAIMECTIPTWVTHIFSLLSVMIAFFTLRIGVKSYKDNKKGKKTDVLSKYSMRYTTDTTITKVLTFLRKNYPIDKAKAKKIKKQIDGNRTDIALFDLEMFMRFFEELQIEIEQKSLEKELVFDMFSNDVFISKYLLIICIENFNEDKWKRFRLFSEDMEKIKEKRERNKKCCLKLFR